jgi:hypothetical protein
VPELVACGVRAKVETVARVRVNTTGFLCAVAIIFSYQKRATTFAVALLAMSEPDPKFTRIDFANAPG